MDCPHFDRNNFHPQEVGKALKLLPEDKRFCSNCQVETDSRWICLSCGVISCGRFEKGHAMEHFKSTSHRFALDLISMACHCYLCDDYVHAGPLEQELDQLRQNINTITSGLDDEENM
jgi:ubiquitin carboxyl-terminal hydrolase 3